MSHWMRILAALSEGWNWTSYNYLSVLVMEDLIPSSGLYGKSNACTYHTNIQYAHIQIINKYYFEELYILEYGLISFFYFIKNRFFFSLT